MVDNLSTLLSVLKRDESHLRVCCAPGNDIIAFPNALVQNTLCQSGTSPSDRVFAISEVIGERLKLAVCIRFAWDGGLVLLDDVFQVVRRGETADEGSDRLLERTFKSVGRGLFGSNSSH